MDLENNLEYLLETKNQIKQALIDKGCTIEDTATFRSYVDLIAGLTTGGSGDIIEVTFSQDTTYNWNPDKTSTYGAVTKIMLGDYNLIDVHGKTLKCFAGDVLTVEISDNTGHLMDASNIREEIGSTTITHEINSTEQGDVLSYKHIISFTLTQSAVLGIYMMGTGCCVPYNAPITMNDGTFKDAKDVVIGDTILAYNEQNKYFTPAQITQITHRVREDIITVNTEFGSISMTPDHPILTNKGWASFDPQASLSNYDIALISLTDDLAIMNSQGEFENITTITETKLEKPIDVYTFNTTDGIDTFIAYGYIVHNAVCK